MPRGIIYVRYLQFISLPPCSTFILFFTGFFWKKFGCQTNDSQCFLPKQQNIDSTGYNGCRNKTPQKPYAGFATKTIPQGAPLPTEHSKITILHGIGCSLNLRIGKLCCMFGHPLLQKARTFGLGPPRPPPNQHNRFQSTVPSHIKSCKAH